jgi:hypothetical protein
MAYEAVVTDDEGYDEGHAEGQVLFHAVPAEAELRQLGEHELAPDENGAGTGPGGAGTGGDGGGTAARGFNSLKTTSMAGLRQGKVHRPSDPNPPSDLDEFFRQLYEYYRAKGYWPIVVSKVAALFRVFFMVSFATFGIVYLKWESLALCTSHEECLKEGVALSDYVRPLALPPLPAFIVTIFVLVFSLYWLFDLLNFLIFRCWWIRYMRRVYEQDLQILPHELRVMSWDQVVERYQQMHRAGRQAERRNEPSTAHEIAMRIMRRENYFVYLVDQGMFEFRMNVAELFCCLRKPCLSCCCGGQDSVANEVNDTNDESGDYKLDRRDHGFTRRPYPRRRAPRQDSASALNEYCCVCCCSREDREECAKSCRRTCSFKAYFSPLLVRAVRWLITDQLVQQKDGFRLDRDKWQASSGEQKLRRRSRCLALAILVGMPFILMYQFVEFFLRYAQEFSKGGGKQGGGGDTRPTSSRFTPYWRWMFREYNELPHVFERRIGLSVGPAQRFLAQFYNPVKTVVARSVYFVSGSFIALLLVLSLLGDSVMLYISILERNLLWYLSVFGAIAALSRSAIPPGIGEGAAASPSAAGGGFVGNFQTTTSVLLRQVVTYTHWRPSAWFRTAHTLKTRDSVANQMKPQIVCMLMELRSTLFLPYILAFKLPSKAKDIIERIDRGTVSAPSFSANPRDSGIGDVCRPALFLFEDRSGAEELSKSSMVFDNETSAGEHKAGSRRHAIRFHSQNAKIEKSLLNFRTQHPTWAALASSATLGRPNASTIPQGALSALSASHTGDDLVAALARFQDEQVGGIHGTELQQKQQQQQQNPTLRKMAEDLSASRILADGHLAGMGVSSDAFDEGGGTATLPRAQQSLTLGRSSSNFFSTNHMVELPVDHPSVSGIYPSAEPLFFWLDKFYEGKAADRSLVTTGF